jgi:hypothetical protein
LRRILEELRDSGFRELAGARVTARVPVPERLINEFLADAVPQSGAVRRITVHPQPGDRIGVRVKLARPEFLPPLSATLLIERQPDLPASPTFVFQVLGLAGLLALGGPFSTLGSRLPRGVYLERDRLSVNLAEVLAHHGLGDCVQYVERLRVSSEAGCLVFDVEAAVDSGAGSLRAVEDVGNESGSPGSGGG